MSYIISTTASFIVAILCAAALVGAYLGHRDESFRFYPDDKWILIFIGAIGAANIVTLFTL